MNNEFIQFMIQIKKDFNLDNEIIFWNYYKNYNNDFLNIIYNKDEWKEVNAISSLFIYFSKFDYFTNEYKYKKTCKCKIWIHKSKKKYLNYLYLLVLMGVIIIV